MSALRRLSYSWPPRKAVSDKAKRAPATFECEDCGIWCYTGKSKTNLAKLKKKFPKENIVMERFDIDHIIPVISIKNGFTDWNELVEGMFCGEENLWGICKVCHQVKTKKETQERKEWRQKKKESK
jgi:5-methylcytosine-specific restriction endonuclease McrA